jgi:threonine dehydrogenase-like Zn-dependent dehydrogenase
MKDAPTSPKFIRTRGLRFPYDPQIITRKRRRLMRDDHYEHKESEAVLRVVKPDDTVIELGAGMGYMSTLLAKKLGVKTVHAFEANPRMIPYIHAVHAANGVEGVTVHNAILGAADGRAKFYVRGDFVIDIRNAQAVFDAISPTVLVCDIEGAEADLLPLIDLSGLRCAIVELHPQWIGQAGVQAVFDAMQAGGLTYYPRMSNAKVVTFRKGW